MLYVSNTGCSSSEFSWKEQTKRHSLSFFSSPFLDSDSDEQGDNTRLKNKTFFSLARITVKKRRRLEHNESFFCWFFPTKSWWRTPCVRNVKQVLNTRKNVLIWFDNPGWMIRLVYRPDWTTWESYQSSSAEENPKVFCQMLIRHRTCFARECIDHR